MEWDGLFYATHPDVYEPHHDSFLLARAVEQTVRPGTRLLDVGCGTGIVSLAALRAGASALATDANGYAVALAARNAAQNRYRLDVVRTDLMAGISGPFDVVAFNPPYLPTTPEERVKGPLNLAFDGGADGNRMVLRFAAMMAASKDRPPIVLIVHSDLSDPRPLDDAMASQGYQMQVVARQRHPFEELTVRRFDAAVSDKS